MKFFRTAIILLVILVIAGFAYWYFEVKRSKEKKLEGEKESLLFGENDREIVKIVLKQKGEPDIVMERIEKEEGEKEEKWMITSPVKTPP